MMITLCVFDYRDSILPRNVSVLQFNYDKQEVWGVVTITFSSQTKRLKIPIVNRIFLFVNISSGGILLANISKPFPTKKIIFINWPDIHVIFTSISLKLLSPTEKLIKIQIDLWLFSKGTHQ